MWTAIISIAVFVVLVGILAAVRIYSQGRVTIEGKEILAAVALIAIGLFAFGEVSEIAFGDLRLVRAVKQAEAKSVESRRSDSETLAVTEELDFTEEEAPSKGAASAIPDLISSKAAALSFEIGRQGYVHSVVAKYILDLSKAKHLRHLVFNDAGGRLVGIADARLVAAAFRMNSEALTPQKLTEWIKSANLDALAALPGYVDGGLAVISSANTRDTLDFMVNQNAEVLPVVDGPTQRFRGVVYRDQLVFAILRALTGPVEES